MVGDRREVGAGLLVIGRIVAVYPVRAATVLLVVQLELVPVDAAPEPGCARTGHVARGAVDVEQRALGQPQRLELLDEPRGERGGLGEVELVAEAEVHLAGLRLLRDGNAGHAQNHTLERGRHGARVGDVVAQVRAVVDAGDDQLGRPSHEAERGQSHAVDRRAVGREADRAVVELDLLDYERTPRRYRARRGALVRVRRDNG